MRRRSRARGWALQLLYAWETRNRAVSLPGMLEEFLSERRIAESNRQYLETLIGLIAQNQDAIDRALDRALTNWRLDRLSVIDRNILRIGAAEILYLDEVPPRVSIQEALGLAERYGTVDSPRFVNGVLDALMRGAQRATGAPGSGEPH